MEAGGHADAHTCRLRPEKRAGQSHIRAVGYVIDDKGVTAVPLQGSLIRQRTVLMLMLVVAIMMAVSLSRIAARAAVTGRIERSEG